MLLYLLVSSFERLSVACCSENSDTSACKGYCKLFADSTAAPGDEREGITARHDVVDLCSEALVLGFDRLGSCRV